MRLTSAKHELFCQQYVTNGFNGSAAARHCGYSENGADVRAHELMQRMDVQLRIEVLKQEQVRAAEITREKVIATMAAIATVDRRKLLNTPIDQLTEEEAMCIDGFKLKDGMLSEIKTVSRGPMLKSLAEFHNIFEDHQKSGQGVVNVHIDGKDAEL